MPKKTQPESPSVRAPNLNEHRIREVVRLLDGWNGRLTWGRLIASIAAQTKSTYTRQGLDRHPRIKLAFQAAKERLANFPTREGQTRGEEQRRLAAYDRLVGENARLEKENNALLEQFARWAYNASLRGLSEAQLNAPLPVSHRGASIT